MAAKRPLFKRSQLIPEPIGEIEGARFDLGSVKITPAARQALADSRQPSADYLTRHARGDWGKFGDFDTIKVTPKDLAGGNWTTTSQPKLNKIAMVKGLGRVVSDYAVTKDVRVRIFTSFDDGETVVLLSEEW